MSFVRESRGFTLVEVVLALGICTFALIALLGLMLSGMQASRSSEQDTLVTMEAKYVLSDLQHQTFPPASTTNYFDAQGIPATSSNFYTCAVAVSTNPAPFAWAAGNPHTVGIKLTFTWPGQTAVSGTYAQVFWTSLSAY